MFKCAGSVVIACAITHAFAIQTPRLQSVDPGAMTQFAFIVHHKTGCHLFSKMAEDIATTLGKRGLFTKHIESTPKGPQDFNDGFQAQFFPLDMCDPHLIPVFNDMTTFALHKFLKTCPDTRIVHSIRRPSSAMASNYLYEKRGSPQDGTLDVSLPLLVRSMPSGITWECNKYRNTFFNGEPGLKKTHTTIQDIGETRIKEVRLEDFDNHFDETSTSMFEHLLGKGHPMIPALVAKAAEHDVNRQSASDVVDPDHISDPNETREVQKTMNVLRNEGDSCMQQLQRDDAIMGYDDSFWS